jgi:hypothetical protein
MGWGPIISALLTLILALFGLQWQDQRRFNKQILDELKGKKDKTECEKDQHDCPCVPIWQVFDRHSHTGLTSDSIVLRRT